MKRFLKIMSVSKCVALPAVLVFISICTVPDVYAAHEKIAEDAVSKVKEAVLTYFIPSSGTVVTVEDRHVKISIDDGRALNKGMRFSVFRKGEPFFHPVTKEKIGYTEEHVGRIEVINETADSGVYMCRIIHGNIKNSDIIRVTSSRIKLAFFQDRKAEWLLSEALFNSLKDSGRFDILETYTSSYDPSDLTRLARELGAEAVLMLSTPARSGRKLVNVRLYWADDAGLFAELEEELAEGYVKAIKPEDEMISVSLADTEPWGGYDLPGGKLLAVGDVDGNGREEIIISDGTGITVYDFKEELQELWSIKGGKTGQHISLDVLDLNNNGIAEIFVTSIINGFKIRTDDTSRRRRSSSMRSFVVEYDPAEGYRKIKDHIPYFLRISGSRLLMQGFDQKRIFSGPVFEGGWIDGDYKPDKELNLPPGVNIYGFTFVDWKNRGQSQIVSFDDKGYLILYDGKGEVLWKGEKSYGKFDISFERDTYSIVNPGRKWSVRGRLMPVQTERGQEVVVVRRVPILSKVPGLGLKGAEVSALWWDGDMMDETLFVKGVSGNISDYRIKRNKLFLIARGSLFSFAKNAISGEFKRGSMLYYFNFTKR